MKRTIFAEAQRIAAIHPGLRNIRTAVLFMGAVRIANVGDWPLTFTASEGVEAARAFSQAMIVPVHYEGWDHLSESRPEITQAFAAAGLNDRLRWLPAGTPTQILDV